MSSMDPYECLAVLEEQCTGVNRAIDRVLNHWYDQQPFVRRQGWLTAHAKLVMVSNRLYSEIELLQNVITKLEDRMSKRHYEAVAEAISQLRETFSAKLTATMADPHPADVVDLTAIAVSAAFRGVENARFDPIRFLRACGVPEYQQKG